MEIPTLIEAAIRLRDTIQPLAFDEPVTHVYHPLEYAWAMHAAYLHRYGEGRKRVVFLGMNPGPWGMAQTGVPFGEIAAVRDWMQLHEPISKPTPEHPKRPIVGLDCSRSEVSGKRLWGLFQSRFGKAEAFFKHHFVVNYCPLVFMEAGGKNRTPDKLPAAERAPLEAACDAHLLSVLEISRPDWLIGVGGFAHRCASRVVQSYGLTKIQVGNILHPSPASPAANRDWAGTATRQLQDLGVWG